MTGDHHGRGVGQATLLVRAVDAILGTHSVLMIRAPLLLNTCRTPP
jgi:hypothetical protein